MCLLMRRAEIVCRLVHDAIHKPTWTEYQEHKQLL